MAGRKPKPPGEKQSVRQQVMLTPGEREELEAGAKILGASMGDVLRVGGFAYLRRELARRERAEPSKARSGKPAAATPKRT